MGGVFDEVDVPIARDPAGEAGAFSPPSSRKEVAVGAVDLGADDGFAPFLDEGGTWGKRTFTNHGSVTFSRMCR